MEKSSKSLEEEMKEDKELYSYFVQRNVNNSSKYLNK